MLEPSARAASECSYFVPHFDFVLCAMTNRILPALSCINPKCKLSNSVRNNASTAIGLLELLLTTNNSSQNYAVVIIALLPRLNNSDIHLLMSGWGAGFCIPLHISSPSKIRLQWPLDTMMIVGYVYLAT